MIIKAFLDVSLNLIRVFFGWINIPNFPVEITSVVDQIFNYVAIGLRFVLIFFDMNFLRACIPVLLIIINFEHIYEGVMFVMRKVPFLNIR